MFRVNYHEICYPKVNSKIESKHCTSLRVSVNWSGESLVHLQWIKRAYCSLLLYSSTHRELVRKPKTLRSNPRKVNSTFQVDFAVQVNREIFSSPKITLRIIMKFTRSVPSFCSAQTACMYKIACKRGVFLQSHT